MTILVSILVLGVLVFVHELGHFLVAKWCGVGVIEFSIGFGKKLFRKRWGDSWYSLRLIPLGGYVRMAGDDPQQVYQPATTTSKEDQGKEKPSTEQLLTGEEIEEDELTLKLMSDRSLWFLEKNVWAKIAIILAGPFGNIVFALLAGTFSFYIYGKSIVIDQPIIGDIIPDYPAAEAGLLENDRIVAVDGEEVDNWSSMAEVITQSDGRGLTLTVERANKDGTGVDKFDLQITGKEEAAELAFMDQNERIKPRYMIGILPSTGREPVGLFSAAFYGSYNVWMTTQLTVRGLVGLFGGAISPKNIGGPIIIFREAARSARRGFERLIDFMVFLSVSLAVLNLLPIPVLDGGHLVFFVIEAIKGSPVNLRVQELANQFGLVFILGLMVFALGNDLFKVFGFGG